MEHRSMNVPSRTCAAFACALLMSAATNATPLPQWQTPWLLPFDLNHPQYPANPDAYKTPPASQQDTYDFAWQSFIALNWPWQQGGPGGQPDPNQQLAGIANNTAPHPIVVWESYMEPEKAFTPPKHWPVDWGNPEFLNLQREPSPPCYSNSYVYGKPFAPGINQPYTNANVPTGPLVDQNKEFVRVEVKLSQPYFQYIKQFKYYDADNQVIAVDNYIDYANQHDAAPNPAQGPHDDSSNFQPLPTGLEFYLRDLPLYARQGITEIKAAWKVLKTEGPDADIPGRYFRRVLQFPLPDGGLSEPTLMGLIGFHIHRVTPFGHLPSTFEHVDNVRLEKRFHDSLPLPAHPALNPGAESQYGASASPNYPNGYEVGGKTGEAGLIPSAFKQGDTLPTKADIKQVNVSRETPIPIDVQIANKKYQWLLRDSVWSYYQLIGTQNKSLQVPNSSLGPGIPGAQHSNTENLVNTTLETYTQKGFSCSRCHLNAFPHGVTVYPPYEKRFEDLHVMSFLLLNARSGREENPTSGCAMP
ncbi:hypothetical protein KUV95_12350 [Microbulbifer agarilyticus]|uniref:hypothetical protein n=1 Tax=Microbulbifer agarilyticus TaxID=260552 RepID=UPI001C950FC4|nr:hypothetical protein [Microbulbifer agarilyticus]MBY6212343.1 hypothetical protein [Microbulbifer agarilyticus]